MLRCEPYRLMSPITAVDKAMLNGVSTQEIQAIAEFWKTSGANNNGKPAPWNRPDLHQRIFNAMPGEDPSKHWPPAGSWQRREAKT